MEVFEKLLNSPLPKKCFFCSKNKLKTFSKKNEYTHKKIKNLGMVEIYISISQFSAHPSGQPLNHMWQDGKQSVTWDCWWGGQHFWSHSSLHQIILLFGKFVVFVPLLKNCKKFEKIARTKALSLENVHKKSMKKHSTMSRNALETKKIAQL